MLPVKQLRGKSTFVVSLSNHERTRAEFRSFLERVEMTFSRIALRCIRATPLLPFVVRFYVAGQAALNRFMANGVWCFSMDQAVRRSLRAMML